MECATATDFEAGPPAHDERGRVGGPGRAVVLVGLVSAAGSGGVPQSVEQADLEEREAGLTRTELVLELDEQRRQEAAVDEELRVVHQQRVGTEAERGEQLERIARIGSAPSFHFH